MCSKKEMTSEFFLSVVVPVYNEKARLHNLNTIIDYFKNQNFSSEIIVVNDGSIDNTLELLKKINKHKEINIISYPKNRGKGFALKTGMLAANGKYRLFTDIDLSTPIEEFKLFYPLLKKTDIIIATRKTVGATLLKRQPFLREMLGKCFTLISRKFLGVEVSDFTCGFKCFSDKSAQSIFSKLTVERWGFDSECMFLAKKYKFKVAEVPTRWQNDPSTKVKFPQDIFRSIRDLVNIRTNDVLGKYPVR